MQDSERSFVDYATFNRRMIASTIDVFIACLILTPITKILEYFLFDEGSFALMMTNFFKQHDNNVDSGVLWEFLSQHHIIAKYLFVQFFLILCMALIFIGSWVFANRTIGKMITKCVIIDSRDGGVPTKKQYIIRFFSYILSIMTLFIGFVMILFTKRRQGLHDILSNTVVIVNKQQKNSQML